MDNPKVWDYYFKEMKEIGTDATELSYRTPFENLINTIKPHTNIKIIHE